MYPFISLLTTSAWAVLSKPTDFGFVCDTTFQCMPRDIDMLLEMNNGRNLTLYDLRRSDLSIRVGLAKALRKRHGDWLWLTAL
jgi:hypothetical protein